ncbi:hypothetical protein CYCD_18790 [Tenuifilaceae bacterium CYCD]|nr:hypothetical protein CYCD_18790 [Tenuifilaceae bacterium CYCD]
MADSISNLGSTRGDFDSRNRDGSANLEQKYRLVFENSPVGIFQFDNNLVITNCNDKFVEIFLSSKDKLVGLDMHLLNDKAILNACEASIAGNQGFYEGIYHATTSPAVVFISLKTATLFSPEVERVDGGLGIVEDITERIKAEEELKSKEKNFRILSSLTTDAASVLTINPDGSFKREWLSESLLNILGYAPEDIDSFEKWALIVHPDDLATYQQSVSRILKGETVSIDLRILIKGGDYLWINNTVYPEYDEFGKPIRLISAIKNITAQKEAELALSYQKNLLDTIIDVAPVGIWLTASDGSYPIINKNFSEQIGYGTPNFSMTPEELEQCKLSDDLAAKSNEPVEKDEEITFVDGRKHTIKVYKRKVMDANGSVLGVLGVSTDITLRKHYEKALVEALEKAEESDRLKSAFLANMSHEIRTPLNGIIGFAKYLRNFPETSREETLKFLNIICNSADHLLNLINDIIDISKIEVGQMKIAPEPLNLNELLNEIYTFYYSSNPDLTKSGVGFRIKTSLSDAESNIITDKIRLRQILNNLVANALKFTKAGSVEFGYELTPDKKMLKFFVSDTGIGISQEKVNLIFERFSQADVDITRKYGGTGLGLAISKSLVELMGGSIWVESQPEMGATFFFTLPLNKTLTPALKTNVKVNASDLVGKLSGIKVLIAEDDPNSLYYLKTVLQNVGVTCKEALNGREAVNIFLKNPEIDLIIMDLKMPELSGFDAIKEIRKVKPKIPILVQTAHVFNDEKVLCRALGCDNFISKPVDIELLLSHITQMLKIV